jgi:hypothetical protein
MALTAATLYECLETHVAGSVTYQLGEVRRGDGVAAPSPDGMWILVGSSDAAKLAQRASNGLSNLLPTS